MRSLILGGVTCSLLVIAGGVRAQQPSSSAVHEHAPTPCVDEKPGVARPEFGCFVVATIETLRFREPAIHWILYTFPTRAAAEAAKTAAGAVVEEAGRVWLFEFGSPSRPPSEGKVVAGVGPLHLPPAESYAANIAYAVMRPGDYSGVHIHPGPEAWYVLSGVQCLETPAGATKVSAGGIGSVAANIPMDLHVIGSETRRAFRLILHDSKQPRAVPSDWKPSGACRK